MAYLGEPVAWMNSDLSWWIKEAAEKDTDRDEYGCARSGETTNALKALGVGARILRPETSRN